MGRKIKLYLAIAGISFIQGLQMTLNPVLAGVQSHYAAIDVSLIQMLVTIPAFIAVVFSILSGYLVVVISKKKMLLFSAVLALVTGLVPFISDNFYLLFAMRMIYGIALGFAMSLNSAVVSEFFEGPERVTAMGVQAATVGIGYLIVQSLSGVLGKVNFKNAYFISFLAVVSFLLLLFFLPETGKAVQTKSEKVSLSAKMIPISVFGFFSMMCIISFTTNISMHLGGPLKGNSSFSGSLLSVFSVAQIVVGLGLGIITKITKKYVLAAAMIFFVIAGSLLAFNDSNMVLMVIASLFVGFAQGTFIPSAYVEASNAVPPIAVALASAVLSAAMNIGQTVSPYVLNTAAKVIFRESEASTGHVYMIGAIIMAVLAICCILYKTFSGKEKKN